MRVGPGLLILVTIATLSVAPAVYGQSICYPPDGTMYIGYQPPPDCAKKRPKSRDEAIQKRAEQEAAGRPEREAARREAEKSSLEHLLRQSQDARRQLTERAERAIAARAGHTIAECQKYRAHPEVMDAALSSMCYRYWSAEPGSGKGY